MTTMRAGLVPPNRPVGHLFELRGWASGISGLDELSVRIGDRPADLTAAPCPGAPAGALGFRARPHSWVPTGTCQAVLAGADGAVLDRCAVRVGSLPGEPPLFMGEIDWPRPGKVVTGQVVQVCGWALLNGRAPSLVEVLVDGAPPVRARTRLPRPDVAAAAPGFGDAAISGFDARVPVDLPAGGERPLSVRIRCRTEGAGERLSPQRPFVLRNPAADPEDVELVEVLAGDTATDLARVQVRTDPRHVLVFTHCLTIGGAQLWLQELLERLVTAHGWRVSLVSAGDGPLRAQCAELGIPVHVTTGYRSTSVVGYEGHVGELARFARCSGAGVALVNTLGGVVAADAAKRAGLPTAWAIHESYPLPEFAHHAGPDVPPPALWPRWHSTLAEADLLLFVADATRELFLPYSKPERCRTVRYGTPLWTHGGRTDPRERRLARAALGFADEDVVLVSVGVTEPRKGHGPLVSAMDRIRRPHPRARLGIVGLRRSPYADALSDTVDRVGLANAVRLVPVAADPTPWLRAADIFVNASDVESLPRSILEAVCCGVPVAATDVFGAREMIVDGQSGWLFEPNDVDALTAGLLRALDTDPARRRRLAAAAHARLAGWLDPAGYARTYSAMLAGLAGSPG